MSIFFRFVFAGVNASLNAIAVDQIKESGSTTEF